jgi:hypothetical protein
MSTKPNTSPEADSEPEPLGFSDWILLLAAAVRRSGRTVPRISRCQVRAGPSPECARSCVRARGASRAPRRRRGRSRPRSRVAGSRARSPRRRFQVELRRPVRSMLCAAACIPYVLESNCAIAFAIAARVTDRTPNTAHPSRTSSKKSSDGSASMMRKPSRSIFPSRNAALEYTSP